MRKLIFSAAAVAALSSPVFADVPVTTEGVCTTNGQITGWNPGDPIAAEGDSGTICVQGYNLKSASESESEECGNGQSTVTYTTDGGSYTVYTNGGDQKSCYVFTAGSGDVTCTYTGPSGTEQNAEQKLSSLCPSN